MLRIHIEEKENIISVSFTYKKNPDYPLGSDNFARGLDFFKNYLKTVHIQNYSKF